MKSLRPIRHSAEPFDALCLVGCASLVAASACFKGAAAPPLPPPKEATAAPARPPPQAPPAATEAQPGTFALKLSYDGCHSKTCPPPATGIVDLGCSSVVVPTLESLQTQRDLPANTVLLLTFVTGASSVANCTYAGETIRIDKAHPGKLVSSPPSSSCTIGAPGESVTATSVQASLAGPPWGAKDDLTFSTTRPRSPPGTLTCPSIDGFSCSPYASCSIIVSWQDTNPCVAGASDFKETVAWGDGATETFAGASPGRGGALGVSPAIADIDAVPATPTFWNEYTHHYGSAKNYPVNVLVSAWDQSCTFSFVVDAH
ncbi:MAG TPA: hypothetical protein VEK07_23970 [Polyangiaceae bacterium]|nr:hypothetical protein [Polyangiaceae bacterium]